MTKIQHIRLDEIISDPDQPRQNYNIEALRELATSISQNGVLQPIMLRKNPDGGFIVVYGERRFRAAQIAKEATIPAEVRDTLKPEQIRSIQLIENLHRQDVHPMEEGRAFHAMVFGDGMTVKELALRVGKTEKYVNLRLQYTRMIPDFQNAFLKGELTMLEAKNLCLLDEEAQESLFKSGKNKAGAFNANVDGHMLRNHRSNLGRAPFDLADTNLNPTMGACLGCKHNSATSNLFTEEGESAQCSKPSCFTIKFNKHMEQEILSCKTNNIPLVSHNQTYYKGREAEMLEAAGHKILFNNEYREVKQEIEEALSLEDYIDKYGHQNEYYLRYQLERKLANQLQPDEEEEAEEDDEDDFVSDTDFNDEDGENESNDEDEPEEEKQAIIIPKEAYKPYYDRYLKQLEEQAADLDIAESAFMIDGNQQGNYILILRGKGETHGHASSNVAEKESRKAVEAGTGTAADYKSELNRLTVNYNRQQQLDKEKIHSRILPVWQKSEAMFSENRTYNTLTQHEIAAAALAMHQAGTFKFCNWMGETYGHEYENFLGLSQADLNQMLLKLIKDQLPVGISSNTDKVLAVHNLVRDYHPEDMEEIEKMQGNIAEKRNKKKMAEIEKLKKKLAELTGEVEDEEETGGSLKMDDEDTDEEEYEEEPQTDQDEDSEDDSQTTVRKELEKIVEKSGAPRGKVIIASVERF